jgi:hypothetical protein
MADAFFQFTAINHYTIPITLPSRRLKSLKLLSTKQELSEPITSPIVLTWSSDTRNVAQHLQNQKLRDRAKIFHQKRSLQKPKRNQKDHQKNITTRKSHQQFDINDIQD